MVDNNKLTTMTWTTMLPIADNIGPRRLEILSNKHSVSIVQCQWNERQAAAIGIVVGRGNTISGILFITRESTARTIDLKRVISHGVW